MLIQNAFKEQYDVESQGDGSGDKHLTSGPKVHVKSQTWACVLITPGLCGRGQRESRRQESKGGPGSFIEVIM